MGGGGGSGCGPGHLGYGGISIVTIGINHRLSVGPSPHSAGLFRYDTVDWVVKKMFCCLGLESGGLELDIVTGNVIQLLHFSSNITNGYVDRVVTWAGGARRHTCSVSKGRSSVGKAWPLVYCEW